LNGPEPSLFPWRRRSANNFGVLPLPLRIAYRRVLPGFGHAAACRRQCCGTWKSSAAFKKL